MSLRERKKRQAREHMVKIASALINQQGYEQTTMRDIAKKANVSYQTLYNYFPTKAKIVQALLIEDISEISSAIEQVIIGYKGNCIESLNNMNQARVGVVSRRDRGLWREVVIDFFKKEISAESMFQIVETAGHLAFTRLLTIAQENGELDANVDCQVLAKILFSTSEYSFMQFVMNQDMSKTTIDQVLAEQTYVIVKPYLNKL